jgi:methylmalonyl-CoA/ethylmalonyl-CoA epimerase
MMQLGQIAMIVQDVERATAFYADVLGLPLLFRAGALSFFDLGGVRLMLSKPEKPEFDHPGSVLYYKVTDIEARHRDLSARGVAFIDAPHLIARMPDHELWMTFFKDTEGNTAALMEEKR